MAALAALAIFSGDISRGASKDVTLFSSAELTSTSLIVVQRESLAYTTRYTQWLGGDIDRREVQIARALLAQRLNVITSSKLTIGNQLSQQYFENLALSDDLLASTQPGILSKKQSEVIKPQSKEFIDAMLLETRELVAAYQNALQDVLEDSAADRQFKADRLIFVLYLFFALSLMLFGSFIYTLGRQFRRNSSANSQQLLLIGEAIDQLAESRKIVNQLELLDERKNTFISTVNHELRTPLTSIVGYIDILKEKLEGADNEELNKIIHILERNSDNLLNLVEDILSLTNLESTSSGLLKTDVNLKEITENAILSLTPLSEAAHVSVELKTQEDIETEILANRNQFTEVLTNLVGNAIKFSKPGGAVRILIEEGASNQFSKMLRISISDDGVGIPASEIDDVFSSFFRASNVRNSEIIGTGLGLAIVSRIIEEHHGSINVESTLNVGTKFIVEVPVFDPEIDEFIQERKSGVLNRAIVALETSTLSELENITHEMRGVLGFYDLQEQGAAIAEFETWLKSSDRAQDSEILIRKNNLLSVLRENLTELHELKEK
jgi:signal transduction histidine kinase